MPVRHPFLRRLQWNPFAVAAPLAFLGYTAYLKEFPFGRTAGAAGVAVWFGLSAFDLASGHRWLDWLYSDEAEPTRDADAGAEPSTAPDGGASR